MLRTMTKWNITTATSRKCDRSSALSVSRAAMNKPRGKWCGVAGARYRGASKGGGRVQVGVLKGQVG
jgi:hypothetical protein